MNETNQNSDVAARYIRENFEAGDRLATVLVNRRTDAVIQRLARAEHIAREDFQAWLGDQNREGYEIYLSMNALHPNATGRRKTDVATIRHVYLDLDEGGTAAAEALLKRTDLPRPNYLLNTSADKRQVVWKVNGFGKNHAEALQKALAQQTGADPAATDCTRVLRLPGFYNHKYAEPFLIRVEAHAVEAYRPEDFPSRIAVIEPASHRQQELRKRFLGSRSQSERDWAFAKRALARGDRPELVVAAIASYRRYEKHNPQYYAELTVRKAQEALRGEHLRASGPDRA